MHFNIYLDAQTGRHLNDCAQAEKKSRNALIREAIEEWLGRHRAGWPEEIMEFQGVGDFLPFESHRAELQPPNLDPFS